MKKYLKILFEECRGKKAITVQKAKDLLGWEIATNKSNALLKDLEGNYIQCLHNSANRPVYLASVQMLIRHLKGRRWKFNCEPIIIGEIGTVLNGQHSLIALILAEQERLLDSKGEWKLAGWKTPVTMEKAIIYGADESDEVVNTMDTAKPRSITDVAFRSPLFAKYRVAERKRISRTLEVAGKLLWVRTRDRKIYSYRQSPLETMEFIHQHPRLVEAVRFIWENNRIDQGNGEIRNKRIADYYSPGYASCLLYLMASSASLDTDNPDWSLWDKAEDFWSLLPSGSSLKPVRDVFGQLYQLSDIISLVEKTIVLTYAWAFFAKGERIDPKRIKPKLGTSSDGRIKILEYPTFGGIDRGEGRVVEEE